MSKGKEITRRVERHTGLGREAPESGNQSKARKKRERQPDMQYPCQRGLPSEGRARRRSLSSSLLGCSNCALKPHPDPRPAMSQPET